MSLRNCLSLQRVIVGSSDCESESIDSQLPADRMEQLVDLLARENSPRLAEPEVSLILRDCRNLDALGNSILKAQFALERCQLHGEVIVYGFSETTDAVELARELGATIVEPSSSTPELVMLQAVAESRGRYILFADADDGYDFAQLAEFLEQLELGQEFVQGQRLKHPHLNPFGMNPHCRQGVCSTLVSWSVRRLLGSPLHDLCSPIRAFRREFFDQLSLNLRGLHKPENQAIRSSARSAAVSEIAIPYHFRQGLDNPSVMQQGIQCMQAIQHALLLNPNFTLIAPAMFLGTLGLAIFTMAAWNLSLAGLTFGVFSLVVSSFCLLTCCQLAWCGCLIRELSTRDGLLQHDPGKLSFQRLSASKTAIGLASIILYVGYGGILLHAPRLIGTSTSVFEYNQSLRASIVAAGLIALALQFFANRFVLFALQFNR